MLLLVNFEVSINRNIVPTNCTRQSEDVLIYVVKEIELVKATFTPKVKSPETTWISKPVKNTYALFLVKSPDKDAPLESKKKFDNLFYVRSPDPVFIVD